jgi:predicted flap endonuclease-1-like 5' DNA nuclease
MRSEETQEERMANIEDIEGIGPAFATKLRASGIPTVEALLERGASTKGRQEIEEATGISGQQILRWVNHADLFRIKGVAAEYAELLEAAGVDSVPELAQRSPANLQQRMAETNEQKKLTRRVPTEAQITAWVTEAKTLPRVVTH